MATNIQTIRKDPDAVLDYGIDWDPDDDPYLESGETISTSTWTVPSGLTNENDYNGDTTATVWLSGGTAGETYTVSNKIVTNQGRTDERSVIIVVEEQ